MTERPAPSSEGRACGRCAETILHPPHRVNAYQTFGDVAGGNVW
jgi:hypothetical protein